TFVNNRRLKILKAEEIEQKIDPGKMLINSGNHMLVGTPKGTLKILEVQPEGKRRMRIDEFLRGLPAETKTKLQFA
ncbi:methionyl-tRNA formyltransferase, partial [Candidatus Peregrinibacteria bacterium CG11_big_fil_rev_8_21_14_0_20_46_8]